ncbi:hypothetical protein [Rufibacter roseolus]|uniref:hypothetical protein n=1 Tax=Rufibacter roseolus TaxID=2817375 RepID=UPI001B300E36|nr:hypothetical protein [Rufibacter roseolus]
MRHLLPGAFAALLVLLSFSAFSQNTASVQAEPKGGLNALALKYFKIRFTKEQRKKLEDKELEFIFEIDQEGVPTLEAIHGVSERDILDSLQATSAKLPGFIPQEVNGQKQASIYYLKLRYPTYGNLSGGNGYQEAIRYNETKYEDFAYIHKSGQRLDIVFGGMANAFIGKAGDYLSPGGGMKTEILYRGKNGIGGGLLMSFYGNKLKQDYPIASDREQNTAPPTLLLGVGLNKALMAKERKEFLVQLELNYAIQNVTAKEGNNDKDWTQLQGFSPGLVGHYFFQVGKPKAYYYYGAPSVYVNYLNVHAGIRPVFFNLKEATGVMLELGFSFRLGCHGVDEYQIK